MARIPNAEVERLKEEVSVQRLVEARGIELRKHGAADLIGRCPFHDDRTPSLVVSPAKNLWHCLGACQAGGSAIDWVMKAEGVSFRHAVELLRADLPAVTGPAAAAKAAHPMAPPATRSTVRKLPPPVESEAEDRELLLQVVGYYHATLKASPEAQRYLESRGLRSSEMVERFQLGFANRTLGYRLPNKNRKAGEAIRGRLTALGIFRESGHEHLNGSLVIPVFDESGAVVEMYGRKVTPGLKKGIPLHLYLPGPHRGVWNLEGVATGKEVILCESLIDALTFWCAGYRNVTASYGVEGFTADHLTAFRRFGTERVLIGYDRDEAGDRAAVKLSEKLSAEGIGSYRVLFPRGMDANEYALRLTPAEKSLGLALRKAEWMGKGKPPAMSTTAVAVPVTMAPAPAVSATAARVPASAIAAVGPERETDDDELDEELLAVEPVDLDAADEQEDGQGDVTVGREVMTPAAQVATSAPAEPLARRPAETSSLAASPEPPAPRTVAAEPELRGEEVVFTLGDRRYRVRGLGKNLSLDQLRVNVLCARGEAFFVDSLDLYSSRQRQVFLTQASAELGVSEEVLKKDLGKVLLALEELQEKKVAEAETPKAKAVTLSETETEAALELLRDPNLLGRILADFARCGVVGEETNKLVGYLGAVSRKLEEPLAVIIQSSSAAGKSSLMDAILAFVPEEERVQYSAMTGQSLFYMGESDLKHKVLAIVEEEGAERASYALKLLQSEGELTIASTGKDPATGKLITQEYRVEGPVMIFLTTTAIEIDEELLNRCLVLTVDEDREQTRAIHRRQREAQTLAGLLQKKDKDQVLKIHRDAQRLLRPLLVANPFAERLTFIDDRTRTRRDHMKYLTLIRSIALLHQHQRVHKTVVHGGQTVSYIEVALADIEVANRLAHQVLGRSLDELPPQTRRLLLRLDEMVNASCAKLAMDRCDYRFTRREVREGVGWGATQTRVHLDRLVELEYVAVHRGGRGQGFVYELAYDGRGQDGRPFLIGLAAIETLVESLGEARGEAWAASPTVKTWRGQRADLAGGSRATDGGVAAGWRSAESASGAAQPAPNRRNGHTQRAEAPLGTAASSAPYTQAPRAT